VQGAATISCTGLSLGREDSLCKVHRSLPLLPRNTKPRTSFGHPLHKNRTMVHHLWPKAPQSPGIGPELCTRGHRTAPGRTCAPKWWSCAPRTSFSLNNYILGPRIEQPSPKFYLCTRMRKCTPTLGRIPVPVFLCTNPFKGAESQVPVVDFPFGAPPPLGRERLLNPRTQIWAIGMCTNSLIHCPPSNGCKSPPCAHQVIRPK